MAEPFDDVKSDFRLMNTFPRDLPTFTPRWSVDQEGRLVDGTTNNTYTAMQSAADLLNAQDAKLSPQYGAMWPLNSIHRDLMQALTRSLMALEIAPGEEGEFAIQFRRMENGCQFNAMSVFGAGDEHNWVIREPNNQGMDFDKLEYDLMVENERAIRQRDQFLKTGTSTAHHGGSHDTCFREILRRHASHIDDVESLPRQLEFIKAFLDQFPKRRINEIEALTWATHRHYKGGLYYKLGEVRFSEGDVPFVLYAHLYPHDRSVWVRPKAMFEDVFPDGSRRFTPLKEE